MKENMFYGAGNIIFERAAQLRAQSYSDGGVFVEFSFK